MEVRDEKDKFKKSKKLHKKNRKNLLILKTSSYGKWNIFQYFSNIFTNDNDQERGYKKITIEKNKKFNFFNFKDINKQKYKKILSGKKRKNKFIKEMNLFTCKIISLIIKVLLIIIIIYSGIVIFKYIYNNDNDNDNFEFNLQLKYDEISIIVNTKNLTIDKHILFYDIMQKFNTTRNYYFIKNYNKSLNANLNELVVNSTVKLVQSNFPDSIYLPLVVSIYGTTIPEYVLFIEGDELKDNCGNKLLRWISKSYEKINNDSYDYIFGNYQKIKRKKIGCSLLLTRASIIEHLLYYTNSDTTHANPFIQLSLATQTKFDFIPFKYIKSSNLENINNNFSINMNCPSTDDKENPSLCLIIPSFKRNYFSISFPAFANQTYKPKFYVIIQNDNRLYYNLSLVQNMVNETVYHIWMQNWNSFFFLNHRLASVFPCDFIMKYDDDQWPIDNTIQETVINKAKGKNIIVGGCGYSIESSFCGYSPKNVKRIIEGDADHSAVPLLIRPGYIKLDARNNIYRLFGGEDIHLSLNSKKLCDVSSKTMEMKLDGRQNDGNGQRGDKQIINEYSKEKHAGFDLFSNTYCFLIHSGYMPIRWEQFELPQKDYINITINHKSLN